MDFAAIITWLTQNGSDLLKVATSIIGTFALIATMTPNKSDDEIVDKIWKAINFLGANTGKSANKDQ
jgi:hypothetical protein